MNLRMAILGGIAGIVAIFLAVATLGYLEDTEQNKVRLAFFPNVGHVIPIVGLERGIFVEELGHEIIIEKKIFDSGPQVIETLFAKAIDIAYVGPGPAVNGFLKSDNHNIVILAGAASGGASFVIHPDSDIKSADDFVGKRIAAPQIANTQDVSLRYYLSENGLKTAEKGGSVVVLNLANPEIYTLFAKGDIDAAWVPEPWATIFVSELGGTRMFYEEDLWPENQFASVLLIARADYVEEHPEIIQKWISSHEKSVKWINSNSEETEKIFNQFIKKELGNTFPDYIISEALSNIEITSDPIPSSIHSFAQRADSLGYLGRGGYSLDGIFFDSTSNVDLQEVLLENGKV